MMDRRHLGMREFCLEFSDSRQRVNGDGLKERIWGRIRESWQDGIDGETIDEVCWRKRERWR
jgi:hypothetical protein